jgi:hypothetical protein
MQSRNESPLRSLVLFPVSPGERIFYPDAIDGARDVRQRRTANAVDFATGTQASRRCAVLRSGIVQVKQMVAELHVSCTARE